jgi:hypothetical protein
LDDRKGIKTFVTGAGFEMGGAAGVFQNDLGAGDRAALRIMHGPAQTGAGLRKG